MSEIPCIQNARNPKSTFYLRWAYILRFPNQNRKKLYFRNIVSDRNFQRFKFLKNNDSLRGFDISCNALLYVSWASILGQQIDEKSNDETFVVNSHLGS